MPQRFYLPLLSALVVTATHSSVMAGDAPVTKTVAWSYDNDFTGQDEWGYLTPAYAACAKGTEQSPIKIAHTVSADLPKPEFHYQKAKVAVRNKGYTVEVEVPGAQTYTEAGHAYYLRAIQFHTPSEHMISDNFYALETHLIHEDADKNKLIVAIFSTMDYELPALNTIISHIPFTRTDAVEVEFDPSTLLPESYGYYAYRGSLTVPPCTEGIEWRIFKASTNLSKDQLTALAKVTGRNARLPQPTYMRTIKESN